MAVRKKARPRMKKVKKAALRRRPPVCKPDLCMPAGPRICIPDIICKPIRAKQFVEIGTVCAPIPAAFDLIEERIIVSNKRTYELEKTLNQISKQVKEIKKKVR